MAKSKRSAALFEVIHTSRLPKRQNPLLSTRWWFQRRLNKPNPFRSATSAPAGDPVCATDPIASLPEPSAEAPLESNQVLPSQVISNPEVPKQPIRGVDLRLDPDHQQITFKISYYSALVTAFTVLVAIGMAYAVGRKMSHGPIAATASPSSAELRAEPAHPEVLDIAAGGIAKQTESNALAEVRAQLASSKTPSNANSTNATPTADAQRIIGRQYVVIQIYPDKKNADDAAVLLNKNDISCTVENGLAGWASKSWWCVVGTTGFDHIRGNPDYARYEGSINKVSDQFAANSKFKKFEPRAYRWKESTT